MRERTRSSFRGGRVQRLTWSLLLIAAAGLSVAWMQTPETGTVIGEVTNGTAGGAVPEDLTVTLHTFSEMTETGVYTTALNGESSYRFEDVELQAAETAVARAVYEGVTYVSEFATVEPDQETLTLPLTIYERTEHPADVTISQLHLFVNAAGERLQVGAYAVLGNGGDRAYVGTSAGGVTSTWSTRLPDGAENLQFDTAELGGRFVPLENGFADTRPIPPGGASVETSFTYELPFQEGREIAQSFDVPVRAAVLVIPEGDWGLEGPGLSPEGTLDTQMGAALSYTAGPLGANEPIVFSLVPRAATAIERTRGRDASTGLAIGIGAMVAAGVAIALMWRSSSPEPVPEEVRPQVEAIAALDHDFETGLLPEETYREKRRSLKQRVHHIVSDQHR